MQLLSRQYKVNNRKERMVIQQQCKQNIDSYITKLEGCIRQEDTKSAKDILEELYLEDIGVEYTQLWINRINNRETSLESFKRLYLLMANYGFRPYHT